MSGKNDKFIVFGMIAVGVIAMIGVVAVLGIGTYIYTSEKPSPTPAPTPGATSAPAPTAAPLTDLNNTFNVKKLLSDESERTYTLIVELMPDAAPVDMSRMTVHVLANGKEYNVWDFYHGEHSLTGNGDAILDHGETFTLTVYLPQGDVPILPKDSTMRIIMLVNGQTAKTFYAVAV